MYVAGWNMPGYLPDTDPVHFDTFEDAREYIASELESYADERSDLEGFEEAFAEDEARDNATRVRAFTRPFSIESDGYAWWVEPCPMANCTTDKEETMPRPSKNPKEGYLDGYDVRVKNRRRYGHTTFTWLEAKRDDSNQWIGLGDPWPCISPKRAEVHAAVLEVLFPTDHTTESPNHARP